MQKRCILKGLITGPSVPAIARVVNKKLVSRAPPRQISLRVMPTFNGKPTLKVEVAAGACPQQYKKDFRHMIAPPTKSVMKLNMQQGAPGYVESVCQLFWNTSCQPFKVKPSFLNSLPF